MRRFLVFLFAAVFTFSTVGDAFGRRGGGGGGRGGGFSGGGGYRPSYRPSPPMARTPSYARPSQQAAPRAPQATARSTPPASRPQVSQSVRPLPRTVSPSSTVARMPAYRGQVSKAGSPIIRNAAGKPYAVPQQGTLSLRSSLASGASRPALIAAYGASGAGARYGAVTNAVSRGQAGSASSALGFRAVRNAQTGKRELHSPAGIIYTRQNVSAGQRQAVSERTRIAHIMKHTKPDPSKPTHSVFNVKQKKEVLAMLDSAWKMPRSPAYTAQGKLDPNAFIVRMPSPVGTQGERAIRFVVDRNNRNQIITAYPWGGT